jgi:hypothetical protein
MRGEFHIRGKGIRPIRGPYGSRSLGLPDFKTVGPWWWQGFSLTHRPPLTRGNSLLFISVRGWVDARTISAAGMIMSMENSSDTIGSRTWGHPACSSVLQRTASPPVLSWQWGPTLETSQRKVAVWCDSHTRIVKTRVGKRQFFLNLKAYSTFGCETLCLLLMWESRLQWCGRYCS